MLGGPTGTISKFISIEVDTAENVYVGGKTDSVLILSGGSSTNIGYPFVAKIEGGDPTNYAWSKVMQSANSRDATAM